MLFSQSCDKFAAAVKIISDKHEVFYNWGNTLSAQAQAKSGSEADALFSQAYEKYATSVKIKPDFHEAFNIWGNALLYQYRSVPDEKKQGLLEQANNLYNNAEAISPGSGSYNMARVYSLLGQNVECQKWLERASQKGELPSLEEIGKDADLDNVRDEKWFIQFIEQKKRASNN